MQRRQRPERAGGADENVETAPAAKQGLAQPIDRGVIAKIAGDQRGRAFLARPQGADRVVELFERALGSRQGDDVRPGSRKREGDGSANAARGAGHQRDAAVRSFRRHAHP